MRVWPVEPDKRLLLRLGYNVDELCINGKWHDGGPFAVTCYETNDGAEVIVEYINEDTEPKHEFYSIESFEYQPVFGEQDLEYFAGMTLVSTRAECFHVWIEGERL